MSFKSNRLRTSVCAGALIFALFSGRAAIASPAPGADTIVTVEATKLPEVLVKAPRVVTYLSGAQLADAHIQTIQDLQQITPGLIFNTTNSTTATNARLWGVGTVGDNPGIEPSVGITVDGVYRPRTGIAAEHLLDVDHVEILKGPQGTLYGKNTSAGLIDVFSRAPTDQNELSADVSVGNYGLGEAGLYVAGPLKAHVLDGSISLEHDQRSGFYKIEAAGGPRGSGLDDDLNTTAGRGQLLWRPADGRTVRLIVDGSFEHDNCCSAVQLKDGPTATIIDALTGHGGIATTPAPAARLAFANDSTEQRIADGGISLIATSNEPALGGVKLVSISGWRDWNANNANDGDLTSAAIIARLPGQYRTAFHTFSQELRAEHAGSRWHWIAGLYFQDEDLDYDTAITYGTAYETYLSLLTSQGANPTFVSALTGRPIGQSFAAGAHSDDHFHQASQSLAGFANTTFDLTDRLSLQGGVRVTEGRKRMVGAYANSDSGVGCGSAEVRYATNAGIWAVLPVAAKPTLLGALCPFWANPVYDDRHVAEKHVSDNVSWSLKAVYQIDGANMLYMSASTGQKDGGYNLDRAVNGLVPASSLYFRPETVIAYEAGWKTATADDSLMMAVSTFDERFSHFQLNTFLGLGYAVESIPELTSKGLDASVFWRTPVPELKIYAGVVYADTRYGRFTAADLVSSSNFPALSLLPGAQASYAPKWSGSITAAYGHSLAGGRLEADLSTKVNSSYSTGSDLIPAKRQSGFGVLNARLSFVPGNVPWSIAIWADNLTNKLYRQSVINAPLQGTGFQSTSQANGSYYNPILDTNTYDAFLGAPRTFGVSVKVRY